MDEFKDIKYKINIRDIKSSYIKKKIFSFLSEKQLLNLVKYNKELQKISFWLDLALIFKIHLNFLLYKLYI